ncbi:MAG: YCF48-related protein, partial [Saprospiraceae bacterium]
MKIISTSLFIFLFQFNSFSQCWEEINLNVDQQLIPNGDLFKVHFFNDSIGLIFGQFYNLKTTNGGNSWIVTHQENVAPANYYFFNDTVGLYATQRDLYKTIDGGDSWFWISDFFLQDSIRSVVRDITFVNEFEGFAVGNEKMLIKTTDGGYSWEKIFPYDTNFYTLWDIDFIDTENGIAVCACGGRNIYYQTSDGGNTWKSIRNNSNRPSLFNIEMINTISGIGLIKQNGNSVAITNDGWETFKVDSNNYFPVNLLKTSSSRFWMASYQGIYKTENLGRTWESTYFGKYVQDIQFSSISNGWAVGDDYLLLKYNPEEPECVNTLEFPQNASTNNPIQPTIKWSAVTSGCLEGYYISLGTTPDSSDLLYRHFVGLDTSFTPGFELPYDTEIYLK